MVLWTHGGAYERFMGRWSRLVAPEFLGWLACPTGLRWAEVGCGTGALTAAILARCSPASVHATDAAEAQVAEVQRLLKGPRVSFAVASAERLAGGPFDAVVSGLLLNFLADPDAAVRAMADAAPEGLVGAYVWDYGAGMELLRVFWDTATSLDPGATDLHEGHRFDLATAESLADLWTHNGLLEVSTTALTVPTVFADFEDLWSPFLRGQGPAPAYVATLGEHARERLRTALQDALPPHHEGGIRLTARAWAVRGRSV